MVVGYCRERSAAGGGDRAMTHAGTGTWVGLVSVSAGWQGSGPRQNVTRAGSTIEDGAVDGLRTKMIRRLLCRGF